MPAGQYGSPALFLGIPRDIPSQKPLRGTVRGRGGEAPADAVVSDCKAIGLECKVFGDHKSQTEKKFVSEAFLYVSDTSLHGLKSV